MRSFFETYLSIWLRVFLEYIIQGGWKRPGIYPRNRELALHDIRRQINLPVDGPPPDESAEEEARTAHVSDENIATLVIADPPWRTVRASLFSGNPQTAIATCERYYDGSKDTEGWHAIRDTELPFTRNELAELQRKKSKKQTRIPRNNKKVFYSLPEVENDKRHPLAAYPQEAGNYKSASPHTFCFFFDVIFPFLQIIISLLHTFLKQASWRGEKCNYREFAERRRLLKISWRC